ncbi:uncharacterized protein LOC118488259 [Helianthus annuus]|uniref:uncharacterized protein LOC118488259 n=1 Tax=Helianthus annuus TaxID=4232 RepID=UPI0016534091|nr:uncharacterized protein LOC118488259 [Helianthus annuus]
MKSIGEIVKSVEEQSVTSEESSESADEGLQSSDESAQNDVTSEKEVVFDQTSSDSGVSDVDSEKSILSAVFVGKKNTNVTVAERATAWEWKRAPVTAAEQQQLQQISAIRSATPLSGGEDRWKWFPNEEGQQYVDCVVNKMRTPITFL